MRRSPLLSVALLAFGCTAYLDPGHKSNELSEWQGSGAGASTAADPPSGTAGGSEDTTSGGNGATSGGSPEAGGTSGGGGSGNPPQGTGGASPHPSSGGTGGSSTSNTGPPCKRGVAFDRWTEGPALSDLDALSDSVSWFYNWSFTVNPEFGSGYLERGYEFVPMVWNGDFNVDDVSNAIRPDAQTLLGFNEPNVQGNGGTNMSVEEVAALWPQVQSIADEHGLALVAPAVTFSNIPGALDGPDFMRRFFELCPTCRVDAIAMHTYTCEARWVRDHLEPYRQFDLPIWVTEFACMSGDSNQVRTFMTDTVALLENDPDVERYAWFMSRAGSTSLLGAHGQLTGLGELYVRLPQAKPCN